VVNIRGLFDEDGTRITSTDSAFPADTDLDEWIPEADAVLAALLSTAMLAMFNVEQVHTTMKTWKRGLYQQGQQVIAAQTKPLTITSQKRFIIKSVYNAIKTTSVITLGNFMQLPRRGQLTPQQNQQYIDAIEKDRHTRTIQSAGTIVADDTTPDVSGYSVLKTTANTGATAITDLDNPTVGQIIYLLGGSDTNASTITDGGNFKLNGNMTLGAGDSIMLYVNADNDYWELSRTTV